MSGPPESPEQESWFFLPPAHIWDSIKVTPNSLYFSTHSLKSALRTGTTNLTLLWKSTRITQRCDSLINWWGQYLSLWFPNRPVRILESPWSVCSKGRWVGRNLQRYLLQDFFGTILVADRNAKSLYTTNCYTPLVSSRARLLYRCVYSRTYFDTLDAPSPFQLVSVAVEAHIVLDRTRHNRFQCSYRARPVGLQTCNDDYFICEIVSWLQPSSLTQDLSVRGLGTKRSERPSARISAISRNRNSCRCCVLVRSCVADEPSRGTALSVFCCPRRCGCPWPRLGGRIVLERRSAGDLPRGRS